MKYTCQPTGNSLDELGIPKNPYFDPSHVSVASFCLISEGGHSMPPPYRSFHFSIPTDTGLIAFTIKKCNLFLSSYVYAQKQIPNKRKAEGSNFFSKIQDECKGCPFDLVHQEYGLAVLYYFFFLINKFK